MNNKEFIQKFFKGRAVSRPPFLPLVGSYITKVDQISHEQLYNESSTLFSAVSNTQQLLGYDALILPIDSTIEAEALGASVKWSKNEMPVIDEHVEIDRDINPDRIQSAGRVPVLLEAIERLETVNGRENPVIVTLTGPLTVLKKLYGEEALEELGPERLEKKLENITQSLVHMCKNFGDNKVSGILLYEDVNLNTFNINSVQKFYSPIFNVVKYYNMFGVLRFPADTIDTEEKISDTMIGPRDMLLNNDRVRTKGITVNESFWSQPYDQADLHTMWHENKKRRLFLSTSRPLDLHIDLSALQEKIPLMCDKATWA